MGVPTVQTSPLTQQFIPSGNRCQYLPGKETSRTIPFCHGLHRPVSKSLLSVEPACLGLNLNFSSFLAVRSGVSRLLCISLSLSLNIFLGARGSEDRTQSLVHARQVLPLSYIPNLFLCEIGAIVVSISYCGDEKR